MFGLDVMGWICYYRSGRSNLGIYVGLGVSDKHVCPYCVDGEDRGGDMCMAFHPTDHYACTRTKGHSGIHIACGENKHKITTWDQIEKERHPLRMAQHNTGKTRMDNMLVQEKH